MFYEFTYDEITKICPTEAEKVLLKIRSGKSKLKDLPPEQFEWTIKTYQAMHAISFNEMINGYQKEDIPFDKKYFTAVMAKKDRTWADCALNKVPDAIVAKLVEEKLLTS